MKVLLLTLAAAASIATAVAASDSQPSSPAPEAVPAPVAAPAPLKDPNARVCKNEAVIGRRVPSRICMTRAEWDQKARDAKEGLGDSLRAGLTTCATKPCS